MDEAERNRAESASAPEPSHWSAIEAGTELAATVVFAAGFALDPAHPVLERYLVERRIGAGAMGQVLAVQLLGEQSPQRYALKLVAKPRSLGRRTSAEGAPEERSAREDAAMRWLTNLLRNEAAKQEAAQRHGVSVARFIALVRLDDGALGLRMEMARGRSWAALIEEEARRRQEPPDVHRAIRVTRKLLGQLRRLHAMREPGAPSGFVHSDIKPSNVFVDDADPSDPSLTLLDFGVATAGRAAIDDEGALIGRETFVLCQTGGTPGYAPPGHFSARPSPASDVHAAMVCLYELITLTLPWDIDDLDPTPASFAIVELRIAGTPQRVRAARPSIAEVEARALDRFFSSAFSDLQSRALAWSAAISSRVDDDPQRAQALSEELALLAGEYQRSLDALARELESLGVTPSRAPSPPLRASTAGGERASASATQSIEPLLEPSERSTVARLDGLADAVSDGASLARGGDEQTSGTALDTAPTIVANPSRRPPSALDTQSDSPAPVPLSRRRGGSLSIAVGGGLALVGGVLLLQALRTLDRSAGATMHPPQTEGGAPQDAATLRVEDPVLDARAHEPGVSLESAPAATFDLRALPRAFRGRAALLSTAEHAAADAAADVTTSSDAVVLCVASARGVRVIARGGALEREVELCVTDVLSDPRSAEYAGRGLMNAEVLRALPSVLCVGEGRWSTGVRRFGAATGQTWLFTCARSAVEGVDSSAAREGRDAEPGEDGAARSGASAAEDAGVLSNSAEDRSASSIEDSGVPGAALAQSERVETQAPASIDRDAARSSEPREPAANAGDRGATQDAQRAE